jgi:DNA-binding NtrC family response regulator
MPNILVVDDKDSMRNMLQQTLTEEGFRVDSASDGRKALELVRNKSYDLVLTDLKMPDADGLDVLSGVKEVDSDTSVIVMTAYGTIEDAVEAMRKGAFDFITKPFDSEHLCVLVNRALENRRLIAENTLLREKFMDETALNNIIGKNEKMMEVTQLIKKVAGSDASVLLQGESGTGKELFVARVAAEELRAFGRQQDSRCRRASNRGHQHGPQQSHQDQEIPRGPFLSSVSLPGDDSAAAGEAR